MTGFLYPTYGPSCSDRIERERESPATVGTAPGTADLNPWQEIDVSNARCSIEGCGNKGRIVRGWCPAHYQRYRAYGSPTGSASPREQRICRLDGCRRIHYCGGYCAPHYRRARKTGDPGTVEVKSRHEVWAAGATEGTCWSCGETKPADDFYTRSNDPAHPKYGLRFAQCKNCVRADIQGWRDANPEIHRERKIGYQLKRKYGIDRDQYDALLAAQGGGCAICGREPAPDGKRPHVDHDHQTGAVRGILCGCCNSAIGQFREDVRLMAQAAKYLRSRPPSGSSRSPKPVAEADVLKLIREKPWLSCTPRRRSELWHLYRLRESDLQQLVASQCGQCLICQAEITSENLTVDHNHDTGRVRGILCGRCNRSIGLLQDDPAVIRSAIRYLNRRRADSAGIF